MFKSDTSTSTVGSIQSNQLQNSSLFTSAQGQASDSSGSIGPGGFVKREMSNDSFIKQTPGPSVFSPTSSNQQIQGNQASGDSYPVSVGGLTLATTLSTLTTTMSSTTGVTSIKSTSEAMHFNQINASNTPFVDRRISADSTNFSQSEVLPQVS